MDAARDASHVEAGSQRSRSERRRSEGASSRPLGGRLRIFQNAHRWYAAMIVLCVIAFTPTYAFVFQRATWMVHLHAFAMMLWVVMLFAQGWSIRAKRFAWHRAIGRSSYLIAPLMILTGLVVIHQFLRRGNDGVTDLEATLSTLPFHGVMLFAINYGFAIYHRRQPAAHARWMAGTALIVTAGVVRICVVYAGSTQQMATHTADLVAQVFLVRLILSDWRDGYRTSPFIPILLMHLPLHVFFEVGGSWSWWRAIVVALHG
jgi:hypothetical protein